MKKLDRLTYKIQQLYSHLSEKLTCITNGELPNSFYNHSVDSNSLTLCSLYCYFHNLNPHNLLRYKDISGFRYPGSPNKCAFYTYSPYYKKCWIGFRPDYTLNLTPSKSSFMKYYLTGGRLCQFTDINNPLTLLRWKNNYFNSHHLCPLIGPNFNSKPKVSCPQKAIRDLDRIQSAQTKIEQHVLKLTVKNMLKNNRYRYREKRSLSVISNIAQMILKAGLTKVILPRLISPYQSIQIIKKIKDNIEEKNTRVHLKSPPNDHFPHFFSNTSSFLPYNINASIYDLEITTENMLNFLDNIFEAEMPPNETISKILKNNYYLERTIIENEEIFRQYIYVEQQQIKNSSLVAFIPTNEILFRNPHNWVDFSSINDNRQSFLCLSQLLKDEDNPTQCVNQPQTMKKQNMGNGILIIHHRNKEHDFITLIIRNRELSYIQCPRSQDLILNRGLLIVMVRITCNIQVGLYHIQTAKPSIENNNEKDILIVFNSKSPLFIGQTKGDTPTDYVLFIVIITTVVSIFYLVTYFMCFLLYQNRKGIIQCCRVSNSQQREISELPNFSN